MTEIRPILCDSNTETNNLKSAANGKIDQDFCQGELGDCALLTTLYSLSKTKVGEQAIEDALCIISDDAGDIIEYEVSFDSIGETYTVTPEELECAKNNDKRLYSTGDDDVTVLELAFEKCFTESDDPTLRYLVDNYTRTNTEDKLNGVNPASVSYLLTGKTSEQFDKRIEDSNTISSSQFIPAANCKLTDINGQEYNLKCGNYYSLSFAYKDDIPVIKVYDPKADKSIIVNSVDFIDKTYLPDTLVSNDKIMEAFSNFDPESGNDVFIFAPRTGSQFASDGLKTFNVISPEGEYVELYAPHAYSVSNIEDDIVTLVNPHDTSKSIQVQLDSLLNLKSFYIFTLNLDKPKTPKRTLINRAELY